MQNRTGIIALTIIVFALCVFYLSFTFVSTSEMNKATDFATDESGKVNVEKKQKYLDSMRNVNVYSFLGIGNYTLKEVKDYELHLGLDLQGGMHVVLEVSPVEILRALAGNKSAEPNFEKALESARELQKTSQDNFTTLFFNEYTKLAGEGQLVKLFSNSANRGRIDFKTPEDEVRKIIAGEVDNAIDRAYNIIRTRVDKFGVTQPNIQRMPGTGRIQIELPGVDNPERVRKLLQGVAKLEFWEVWSADQVHPFIQRADQYLTDRAKAGKVTDKISEKDSTATDSAGVSLEQQLTGASDSTGAAGVPQNSELFTKVEIQNYQQGYIFYATEDTASINKILRDKEIIDILPSDLTFMWAVKSSVIGTKDYFQLFPIKKGRRSKAPLTGEVVVDAYQGMDERNQIDVSMRMDASGAREWKKLTAKNIGQRIAIVLDSYVYSAPNVNQEIGGGSSSITGNFSIEEAKDLSNILKAGKLPAPTTIVEEAVVGSTLGKAAIAQGLSSIALGLLFVVLFMVAYYASSGFVANAVLAINVFFIIGILAQMNASLTLPGMAGIVLTIGMAVDANVLIFERIREELRRGLSKVEAVEEGYNRAFWSIFDANVTTLLTGFFLYTFGTGPVKGFAVTLIIGIVCSFFTAVFVSKVIVSYWLEKAGDKAKLSFGFPQTMNLMENPTFQFMAKRKLAYAVSGVVILAGVVAIAFGGLNLGVDFKGGRTYVVEFSEDVLSSEVKVALMDDFDNKGTEVKTYDSQNKVKITTNYLIEDETDGGDAKVLAALNTGLKEYAAKNPKVLSSGKVAASIADDIQDTALQSVIFSLLAIFFYILLRFRKWQYGLGAVVALFHDVLVVIGVYAIAGALGFAFEVDQVFIAAILTVIGYSINDTVIVFDRVREFVGMDRDEDETLDDTLNSSINSTLSRTLITSGTTLLVVLVLFIAGGEALRGFSFALLVGLVAGTYSSIFIATPVVADTFHMRKAKKAATKLEVKEAV